MVLGIFGSNISRGELQEPYELKESVERENGNWYWITSMEKYRETGIDEEFEEKIIETKGEGGQKAIDMTYEGLEEGMEKEQIKKKMKEEEISDDLRYMLLPETRREVKDYLRNRLENTENRAHWWTGDLDFVRDKKGKEILRLLETLPENVQPEILVHYRPESIHLRENIIETGNTGAEVFLDNQEEIKGGIHDDVLYVITKRIKPYHRKKMQETDWTKKVGKPQRDSTYPLRAGYTKNKSIVKQAKNIFNDMKKESKPAREVIDELKKENDNNSNRRKYSFVRFL